LWAEFLAEDDARRDDFDLIDRLDSDDSGGRSSIAAGELGSTRQRLRRQFISRLGGRVGIIALGGAPVPASLFRALFLLEVPLLVGYGTTETGAISSGIATATGVAGSVGTPLPHAEIKIESDGEILVRGQGVTPGYFHEPEATREAIDPAGWFHTGDRGRLEADGTLVIIGRKKDIFNTSEGTNIYPARIEMALEDDPLIEQAALVGDRRPYIVALVVPNMAEVARRLGRPADAGGPVIDSELHGLLWPRIEALNEQLEPYERISKIGILSERLPGRVRVSTGALGKTRMIRSAVNEVYSTEIAKLYDE
jgi:long-chain acyl-CoA synthetase